MNMLSRNSILFIVKRDAYLNFLFDWRGTYRPTIDWRDTDYRQTNHWLEGYRLQTDQPNRLQTDQPLIGGVQTTDRPTKQTTDRPTKQTTDRPTKQTTDRPTKSTQLSFNGPY